MIGHAYPFWLGFNGGKAQATFVGICVGAYPHLTVTAGILLLVFSALIVVLFKESRQKYVLNRLHGPVLYAFVVFLIAVPSAATVGLQIAFFYLEGVKMRSEETLGEHLKAGIPFS